MKNDSKKGEHNMPSDKENKTGRKKITPAFIILCITVAIAGGIIIYLISPSYYKKTVLGNSQVIYKPEIGITEKFAPVYTISATADGVEFKIEWSDPESPSSPKKMTIGKIPAADYLTLFNFLDSFRQGQTPNEDKTETILILKRGNSSKETALSAKEKAFMDLKFRIIAEKYSNKAAYSDLKENPSMKVIATNNIDTTGNLAATDVMGGIFYNKISGEFVVYILKRGEEYFLGKSRFIATNFEGLGLIMEREGELYFWEKKMLANKNITLAKNWELEEQYRKVLVSKDSVYYMAPADGGHALMRYDYINRKAHTLLGQVEYCLKDITADGKTLLLVEPSKSGSGGIKPVMIVDAYTGKEIKAGLCPGAANSPECIIGFYKTPGEIIAENENGIEIDKVSPKSGNCEKVRQLITNAPEDNIGVEAVSKDKSRLLLKLKNKGIYYAYDTSSNEKTQINKEPMTIVNPQFSKDGKTIYFFRFDDVWQWAEE